MKKILILFSLVLAFVACSSDDDNTDNTDYYKVVAGHWVKNVDGSLYEEFTFNQDRMLYKEYYTGKNTSFSELFTIDKNNIYTKTNGTYSYVKDGNSLILTSDGVKHELTKK